MQSDFDLLSRRLRVMEVLTRKRGYLDLDGGLPQLDPGGSKNDETREFYLMADLRCVLEE